MNEKRWASRGLVKMLIKELKNYKGAAEVVSGADDVFGMCSRDIAAKVERVEKERSVASSFELQRALDNARQEIAGHRTWQEEVLKNLPKEDDEEGLTGPLRQAFAKTAKTRDALADQVAETEEKYFSKRE